MITITLITATRACRKCEACEALIERLQQARPGAIDFRKVPADAPEAEGLGVVMPPMLIVDDLVVCAGHVPSQEALTRLIDLQAEEESAAR